MITEFKDEKGVKAKEGDIITFPAFLFHRSKPNISKKRNIDIVAVREIIEYRNHHIKATQTDGLDEMSEDTFKKEFKKIKTRDN